MKLRRAGIFTKIVIFALAAYATASLLTLKSRVAEAEAYREELQTQITQAEQENADMSYAIEHAGDDETIEDIAREKLGLVKPGDKVFYNTGS